MNLFFNQTSIHQDYDYKKYKDCQNNKTSDYSLNNFKNYKNQNNSKNISLSQHLILPKDGLGWTNYNGNNIDIDSSIRNSNRLTNKNIINQLKPRTIITIPYMNSSKYLNTDIEQQLRPTLRKNCQKKNDKLIDYDYTFNTFDPILKKNCKKLDYIANENTSCNWVRGGFNTRNIHNNPKYLEKNGYKYNGKFWHK
jgi:hypothetical protein